MKMISAKEHRMTNRMKGVWTEKPLIWDQKCCCSIDIWFPPGMIRSGYALSHMQRTLVETCSIDKSPHWIYWNRDITQLINCIFSRFSFAHRIRSWNWKHCPDHSEDKQNFCRQWWKTIQGRLKVICNPGLQPLPPRTGYMEKMFFALNFKGDIAAQNTPVELWSRYQTNFIGEH